MQHSSGKKKAGEPLPEDQSAVEKEKQPSNSEQAPTGQPDTFSINQALKKNKQPRQEQEEQQGEEDVKAEGTGKDRNADFSQEQVDQALNALAEEYREKPRLYNMLRSRKPEKLQDNAILIRLENPLQQEQINKIYNTVLIRLKDALQNDHITLKTEIARDQTSTNNKLYTDEDRYKYMEQKNKDLRQLRQDFDLDFDWCAGLNHLSW